MELPQPRPIGTEGKKTTEDFLSLCSRSSFQNQDPRTSQGIYPKTRNFLQPLEMVGKNNVKGDTIIKTSTVEKPPPVQPTPPPIPFPLSLPTTVEHILPGGIGTYSISHISNFNQWVPKVESPVFAVVRTSSADDNEEINKANSNSNSCSGGSFTLWEESDVKEMGMREKYTTGEKQVIREQAEKFGNWSTERPLQTPFIHSNSFSQNSQKNRSFMEMMKPGKGLPEDEEDDDEEFVLKKSGSSQKELTVKVDGKSTDQKANTPRSKHSATEQRRRSKINDRFQILRDLIPQTDQKRDKASFLLEVIEYVQFLQEKVHKYETPYQGWSQETSKTLPWRKSHGPGESMIDPSRLPKNGSGQGLVFPGKFHDNNINITPPMLANAHNPVESDQSMGTAYKPMDHNPVLANKAVPVTVPLQPNLFAPVGRTSGLAQPLQRPIPDGENMASQPPPQLLQNRPCATECPTSDALNEKDMKIEGGTISISSVYSHGLLNNLTQALQSSGVDLSQASVSVQIELGKQEISRLTTTTSSTKDHEDPSSSNRVREHSRVTSSGEDSDQAQKKLKREKR